MEEEFSVGEINPGDLQRKLAGKMEKNRPTYKWRALPSVSSQNILQIFHKDGQFLHQAWVT